MEKKDFVRVYLPMAHAVERDFKVPASLILAQASLESAWGDKAPSFNFFGHKAGRNWPADQVQMLWTWEWHKTNTVKYTPPPKQIVPRDGGGFNYRVLQPFRSYASPEAAFRGHAHILQQVWPKAFKAADAIGFLRVISGVDGGPKYATDPDYFKVVSGQIRLIERLIAEQTANV